MRSALNSFKFVFTRTSAIYFKKMSSLAESPVQYVSLSPNEFIAYRQTQGKSPGVIFLPGLMSNMEGTKATALERYCRETGHSYVRFDYRGHGKSSGKSQDCTIGMRKEDVLTILDNVAKGMRRSLRMTPAPKPPFFSYRRTLLQPAEWGQLIVHYSTGRGLLTAFLT